MDCEDPTKLTPFTLRWAVASAALTVGVNDVIDSIGLTGTIQLNSTCKSLTFRGSDTWLSNLNLTVSGSAMGSGNHVVLLGVPGSLTTLKSVVLVGANAASQRGVEVQSGSLSMAKGSISLMKLDNNVAAIGPHGAGIKVVGGNLSLSQMYIHSNSVLANTGDGGGIHFVGTGAMTISDSRVSNNLSHSSGGGIVFRPTNATAASSIKRSTISSNVAVGNAGGGIWVGSGNSPTLTIENVTIHGNSSQEFGGGIEVSANGPVTLSNSTISDNVLTNPMGGGTQINHKSSGTTYVVATIVSGASPVCALTSGALTGPINLWSDTSCTGFGGFPSTNPLLGVLQNNGGSCGSTNFTCLTRKPIPPSPAIGGASTCLVATDQRGFARGPAPCWIGAYED